MAYASNEAVEITVTLEYDNANQGEQGGGGIGPTIGQQIRNATTQGQGTVTGAGA